MRIGIAGLVLDYYSPQDLPTSVPLAGWFGPLRGFEQMHAAVRVYLIPERSWWTEVIALSAQGTWTCWKSNWGAGRLLHMLGEQS